MSILGFTVTTEQLMFLGIGVLIAGLVALALLRPVQNRAARHAARRIDALKPASLREMQSDRDSLRAEFAISAFQLESHIAELRDKTAAHLVELARKATIVERLSNELAARATRIEALEMREQELEAREMSLFQQLRASKEENARLNDTLIEAERMLLDLRGERERLEHTVAERSRTVDRQRLDIVALQTRGDTVCHRVYELANFVRESEGRGAYGRIEFRRSDEAPGGTLQADSPAEPGNAE